MLWPITANTDHRVPRTDADKRKAVTLLLADTEWRQWSDHEIARRAQVSRTVVRKLRNGASCIGYIGYKIAPRKVRRGDAVYMMAGRDLIVGLFGCCAAFMGGVTSGNT